MTSHESDSTRPNARTEFEDTENAAATTREGDSIDVDQRGSTDTSAEDTGEDTQTICQTRPTLKPTLLALGLATVVWLAFVGVLFANPELVVTAELTQIVEILVHLVFAFVAIRLLVKLYILSRMTYEVTVDHVAREYSLLYRYQRREVPILKVRGTEVRRDPIETMLGYGTVSVLTGGVDRGLGFLEFENVPNPDEVASAINDARVVSNSRYE